MDIRVIEDSVSRILTPKRLAHTLGCRETAVKLSRLYGADEEMAAAAALLHDVTKGLVFEEQLNLCEKYGIIPGNVEMREKGLMHALTAAKTAEYQYGAPQAVCIAVRYHTTGRARMTLLEKIIYLADFIEPTRDFRGVAGIRRLSTLDLDGALLKAFDLSIREILGRGGMISPDSIEARNDILCHRADVAGREV